MHGAPKFRPGDGTPHAFRRGDGNMTAFTDLGVAAIREKRRPEFG